MNTHRRAIVCADCGKVRFGVTLATFVCRFCLSMRAARPLHPAPAPREKP